MTEDLKIQEVSEAKTMEEEITVVSEEALKIAEPEVDLEIMEVSEEAVRYKEKVLQEEKITTEVLEEAMVVSDLKIQLPVLRIIMEEVSETD